MKVNPVIAFMFIFSVIVLMIITAVAVNKVTFMQGRMVEIKESIDKYMCTKAELARVEGEMEDNDELMKHLLNNVAKGVFNG